MSVAWDQPWSRELRNVIRTRTEEPPEGDLRLHRLKKLGGLEEVKPALWIKVGVPKLVLQIMPRPENKKKFEGGWIQNWDPDLLEHSMQRPRWHTGSVENLNGRTVLLAWLHLAWNVSRCAVEGVYMGIEEDCAENQAQWHTREM
ncbi:hypothetical protein C8J56DRAFT_900169 [Mycena floridula]|nr:hypothetical protein C8J56DRAFT_900169 [Mycena floridula]